MTISRDTEILGGEPRIDGTRVGIRHVAAHVIDGGYSQHILLTNSISPWQKVYEALAYYYKNLDEIRKIERKREEGRDNFVRNP